MKLIYIGTADFAVPALRAVNSEHDVEFVITQPDRPSGRGMTPSKSPVTREADRLDLPLFQPEDVNAEESLRRIEETDPEGFVLAAYGQKISGDLLDLVDWPVNIHGSLLPKYRGAAPINWAIIRGEEITGVTTILMDEGLDSGPILMKDRTTIGENETAGELHDRLAEMGAELALESLTGLEAGTIEPLPQKGEPSYAPKLEREDGLISWEDNSRGVHNLIRGTCPWPGAYSFLEGDRVKISGSRDLGELNSELREALPLPEAGRSAEPGEIIDSGGVGLVVKCGGGTALKITKVQPPSRCEMSGTDFVNGYHLEIGDRFHD